MPQNKVPAVEGFCHARIYHNGAIKTAQRLYCPAQRLQDGTPVAMRFGQIGFQQDDGVIGCQGFRQQASTMKVLGFSNSSKISRSEIKQVLAALMNVPHATYH